MYPPPPQCRPFVSPVRGELRLYPLSSFAACSSALSEAADPSNLWEAMAAWWDMLFLTTSPFLHSVISWRGEKSKTNVRWWHKERLSSWPVNEGKGTKLSTEFSWLSNVTDKNFSLSEPVSGTSTNKSTTTSYSLSDLFSSVTFSLSNTQKKSRAPK